MRSKIFRGLLVQPGRYGAASDDASFPVDLVDESSGFLLRAELPGVGKEAIQISFDRDVLSIVAESGRAAPADQSKGLVYSERHVGRIARSFRLGAEIYFDKATATYVDGVLELVLPKKIAATRQLSIH